MSEHKNNTDHTDTTNTATEEGTRSNFIRAMIDADLESNKHGGRVVTRFPPEPNGYLHIGHSKSICLNFGLAESYNGVCHLRFDDTNPASEDMEYVESIKRDVKWLGFDWGDKLFFASDYFEKLYGFAVELIKKDLAYVDSLNEEEIREYRGTVKEDGKPSPHRTRTIEENLDLFERMKKGEFNDGDHVLRAKIGLTSSNMKMRDPLLYRIRKGDEHYRRGHDWCIYPMYDFAHCLSDAMEGITHSLCTLEFENNRELYDWILDKVDLEVSPAPEQTEFARLKLSYTVMSKRKLLRLVKENHVLGWDDPRMPTVAGMRRRGYSPEAIRDLAERVGVAKANSVVDFSMLEFSVRNDLNFTAPRVLAVVDPLKVVLTNYPEDKVEELEAPYYPEEIPKDGSRNIPLTREVFIERSDFEENPPKGFRRLSPGNEVRLRYGYVIKCDEVIKDDDGNIVELHCSYDPETLGKAPEGRKVRGAIHWVSVSHSVPAEIRLYDRLFTHPDPDSTGDDFVDFINPDSLTTITTARVEPGLKGDEAGSRYQFERLGYFASDCEDSKSDALVFNRIVPLRDSWAKKTDKTEAKAPEKEVPKKAKKSDKPKIIKKSRAEIREMLRADNPELAARYEKYHSELGLSKDDADVLSGDLDVANYFDEAVAAFDNPAAVAKWFVNELLRELKDSSVTDLKFSAASFAALVELVESKSVTGKIGKKVFAEMMANGGEPAAIIEAKGLKQIDDPAVLEPILEKVFADNAEPFERFRGGEKALHGFFVGQIMKATGGKADPKVVNSLLRSKVS